MTRILSVMLVAGLLVAGGLWLNYSGAEAQGSGEADVPSERPAALDNFGLSDDVSLVPYLSEEPVRSFEAAEEVLEPNLDYQAVIVTNKGSMLVDLFEEQTPTTVNNFVFLARHHYYEGIVFHRVLEDFMAQTGDPTGTGSGGPGYRFEDEIVAELSHDEAGILSMANAGPGTNGSQFFITFTATPWLDGAHTVFGEVVEGEAVLDDLQRVNPQQPSAIVEADDTLADLTAQGVTLAGDGDTTITAYLEENLGALPGVGQSFEIDGFSGVAGRVGQSAAYGFFPEPDMIERVYVLAAPKGD
ncbi:MAG: peptidylprolyl isomerase [Trueperaceae bacterium]|nr:peptidylprolyl isomerase [Trueperaceae bacterium]